MTTSAAEAGPPAGGGGGGGAITAEQRKRAIRETLEALAGVAERIGLQSVARDVRTLRIPKLDDERFSLVVLGEFNHGKSSFVNALLGQTALPTGITPTTAILAHVSYADHPQATLVFQSGERRSIDPARLGDFATVEGLEAQRQTAPRGGDEPAAAGNPRGPGLDLHHVEVGLPNPLLRDHLTIVDTPGVNDINDQRAEITYGYVPRADAAIFLLDATQILTGSERQFLEERILRSSRERLIFVVAKADLLDATELDEALRFAREHLAALVPDPVIYPVSSRREIAGDAASSGFAPLRAQIGLTIETDRRRLLLDHALADAGRVAGFLRQSLEMRRRSLELPLPELEERIARAKAKLGTGQRGLDAAADTITAEVSALKARVRQDLADFAADFRATLPGEIEKVDGHDVRRYLSFFMQDTWKAWLEGEGEIITTDLERLAETIIEVANENVRAVTAEVSAELGPGQTHVDLVIDTMRYDASVFALGALGTTVFLFVNGLVGGVLTLAAPVLAIIFRGRVAKEIKEEAKQRAPGAVDRVAAVLNGNLEAAIDTFGARLREFVAQAGEALARGIAEVLDRALEEKRAHGASAEAAARTSGESGNVEALTAELRRVEERIADVRQSVWQD